MAGAEMPLVRFGVLTDTQYADCDSKPAWYNPELTRYYRTALLQIDKAFEHWTRDGTVTFALQLGDIIDGVNREVSDPDLALRIVLSRFESRKNIPTFHTVGNHELYNFNRRDLAKYFYEYVARMELPEQMFGTQIFTSNVLKAKVSRNLVNLGNRASRSRRSSASDPTTVPELRKDVIIPRKLRRLVNSTKNKEASETASFENHGRKIPDSKIPDEEMNKLRLHTKLSSVNCGTIPRGKTPRTRDDAPFSSYNTRSSLTKQVKNRSDSGANRADDKSKQACDYNQSEKKGASNTVEDESSPSLYYSFRPVPGVKFVSLDCFEVSVIGYEKTDGRYKEAAAILLEHHGHEDFDGWDCADLLVGSSKRFQQMNGAVSEQQLQWLDHQLQESDQLQEKVVVFGHVCLHPESADWDCLLWNYDKVLDIFHAHHCVVLYLCGHTHQNGYALDQKGIHFVVLAGVIETSPEESAFATVAIYRRRIEIFGHGRETSRTLWLDGPGIEPEAVDVQSDSPALAPALKVTV